MLRTVKVWQHVIVGLSILLVTLVVGFGILGAGDESLIRPEHFDAKQVTVWPDGADGVRIREIVDIDFGSNERHGYQREIPNDFGEPTDVTASSPTANDDLSVVAFGYETRLRIGKAYITESGRHRYELEYTLPDANVSSGVLALDIIGNDEEFETERFEIVLTGFDFDGTECDTGGYRAFGGCEFQRDADGNQVAVIEPLAPGDGVTVGGRFASTSEPSLPEIPPRQAQVPTGFRPLGLLMIPLGAAAALVIFLLGRHYGSNEVAGAGAADAAFGDLPLPGAGATPGDVATYRVPDSRLAEMATIEFSPPRGLEPWQASVLLREALDDDTVSAWFSAMIANDALVVEGEGKDVRLRRGTGTGRLSSVDRGHIDRLLGSSDEVALGTYDKQFTKTWKLIEHEQRTFVNAAGWWSSGGPSGSLTAPAKIAGIAVILAVVFVIAAAFLFSSPGEAWRTVTAPWVAIVVGIFVPLVVAAFAYQPMFASRTATGSALALRSESFRRFLAASEGKHVEWAWEHGLLREYSAWAVALGAADAWSKAIESSNIPDRDLAISNGPLVMYAAASTIRSTHVAPSTSGSGGGFSGGGGVGGGGGGGSSGSW